MEKKVVKEEEVDLLIELMLLEYGYDFSNYARSSLKRRIDRLLMLDRFPSFAELYYRLKNDAPYLTKFVEEITVNVTEMFRDPSLYKFLREEIIPTLATNPLIRIWHAGCSTGEEVYSMAILLKEAGLLRKSLLYATDINPSVIENIKEGVFPLSQMKLYSENYILSGGKQDFSSYYTAAYNVAKFQDDLKTKMILATHNLVSDRSFNEFQLIFCRNVLIYFDKVLQDKVLTLFDNSLETLGFLVLGSKENIRFSTVEDKFTQLHKTEKVWRKVR